MKFLRILGLTDGDMPMSGARQTVGSTDFLVGGYAGGGLAYALSREVSVFPGAQYRAAGTTISQAQGKESVVDPGQSILASVGVTYAFWKTTKI